MSIHQAPPTNWVPLTDEIADRLHVGYCIWIEDLTEIRRRMAGLRNEWRMGWAPPTELVERLDDLNERDELYAARHMDTARAFLDAAEADATGTKPHRLARIEQLKAVIPTLKHGWENGWEKADTWTAEERSELMWLIHCNPELKSLFRIAEQNVVYFCRKYDRLYRQYKLAERAQLGLKPRLGLKLLGKKGRH